MWDSLSKEDEKQASSNLTLTSSYLVRLLLQLVDGMLGHEHTVATYIG